MQHERARRTFNRAREDVVGRIPRILWRGLHTAEERLPRRGTSPPGIVRGTAAARPWPARGRGGRATSGYFSCRLLLRCGDYVCPLICAETRQLGPLSAQWVSGSAGLLGPPGMLYHLSPGAFTHTFRSASRSTRERPLVSEASLYLRGSFSFPLLSNNWRIIFRFGCHRLSTRRDRTILSLSISDSLSRNMDESNYRVGSLQPNFHRVR